MVVKIDLHKDLLRDLDNPAREKELQDRIRGKKALRRLYHEIYESYGECLARCPEPGAGNLPNRRRTAPRWLLCC